MQGRFGHLYKSAEPNEEIIRAVQKNVDGKWEKLLKQCGEA
jgi:hypothetical protein